jgi:hypothetical protein
MKAPPPTLTATLTQSNELLAIVWSFANGAQDGLYFCVRTSAGKDPCAAPYTFLQGNDTVLAVTFRRMPLPPDRNLAVPVVPFYRLLEPGQTAHETCVIPLPARELHAYADPKYPDKPIPVAVSKIAFSVEHFWLKDMHFAVPATNDPALYKASGSSLTLLEAALPLDRPVTVLKRTDPSFFRP